VRSGPNDHADASDGLFVANGWFYVLPTIDLKKLEGLFRHQALQGLLREGNIDDALIKKLLGWRLPTLQELLSLIDPTAQVSPILPASAPFTNVGADCFWTATKVSGDAGQVRTVCFNFQPPVTSNVGAAAVAATVRLWCARGGSGLDAQ